MAGIVSVSRTDLAQRRQKLRRQRQIKIIQAIWRTAAVISLAGGLLWTATRPIWVLNAPAQIKMKSGNKFISSQTIQSLLGLSYPQSLWRIQPSAIANALERQPTIAQATVSRRLFPPGLFIEVTQRVPVAIAQTPTGTIGCNIQRSHSCPQSQAGLLDASGVWMSLAKYKLLNSVVKLPTLKVIGMPEQYRPYWTQVYQAINQSSVKIMEVNCQDPTDLILKTELGNVHLGVPGPQITEQIKVLVQMRRLSAKLSPHQVEYIDLKNPEYPLVQMNQKDQTANPQVQAKIQKR
jgi:cell division protein FtsQ